MVYDKSTDLFHLTPKGWVAKHDVRDAAPIGKVLSREPHVPEDPDAPEDRVETWVRRMSQASEWSKEIVDWSLGWESPKHTEEERRALREQHGKPYHDFPDN